ncbi:flavin reductase (DIM6/NTAB) family NADH-FMN oxidoreductase RutF [Yoonia maritima]|uniref:Flavin reductase (DIM6/NTAB) family NADH-FMN oxidoreductase RutF n=1 Tax=Yoonia maritima TaxID=1435347 RepID=A0A2T0VZN6_9RHOB|nr:flavin reductase family protein [Yoonia maritima]PRY77805.1 flavin reductase (DIM6/NTAB) family NADH-FMN oxidoreductase RutF [Yoonia maritima]
MIATDTGNLAMTSFTPDPSNPRQLRDAFGRFATGVTIVTVATDDGPMAITANSFSSLSLDPPLVMWAPDKSSRRFAHFAQAEHFAIHILAHDQDDICWKVARDGACLLDAELTQNVEGVPILPNCLARFECSQYASYDGGDHEIIVGKVLRAATRKSGDALGFFKGNMKIFTDK